MAACLLLPGPSAWSRSLTFDERVDAQAAIERVYHSHLTDRAKPFEEAVPRHALAHRVEDYLRRTALLESERGIRITARMLENELSRMRRQSMMPDRLRELFAALGDDPFVIQETLVRQILVERLVLDAEVVDDASRFDPTEVEAVAADLDERALEPNDACLPYDAWAPLGPGSAPTPRGLHTAVWTGTEMIVWGGTDGTKLGDGARYDPATNTWWPMSALGAPSPRSGHTAVWTGTVMIVWGGSGASDLGSGGRYDPATDSWSPVSLIGAPAPRSGHAAVWTGSRMVVWGGNPATITGGSYDPATDTWSPISTAGAPGGYTSFKAVWSGTRMMVWTGSTTCVDSFPDFCVNSGWGSAYQPATDSWIGISSEGAPSGRRAFNAVWGGNRLMVFGGIQCRISAGCNSWPLQDGGRYDPVTSAWVPMSEGPISGAAVWAGDRMIAGGRSYAPAGDVWTYLPTTNAPATWEEATAIWTGEEVIVWGGRTPTSYVNSGRRFDPDTSSWSPTASSGGAPSPREAHSAIWTGSHMIVWGGRSGNTALGDGSRYDPATASWSPTSTAGAPTPRSGHSAVWAGDRMIVWGGVAGAVFEQTGGRYDPILNSWASTATASAPAIRYTHAAVWTGSQMIVWGGVGAGNQALNTGGRYDPSSDTWLPTSLVNAPSARQSFTAVWNGQYMIVWGGLLGGTSVNTGSRYVPAVDGWDATSLTGAPVARYDHTAVWAGTEMIVWGGRDGSHMQSGGRYNPFTNTWISTSTTNAPSFRSAHSAVWTGDRMIVWGGIALDAQAGGRFDPATDSWLATAGGAPQAFERMPAVWTGDRMIVWGGGSGGAYLLPKSSADVDADGWKPCSGDCDDANAAIHPGAVEACNGVDDDCDVQIDDGVPVPTGSPTLTVTGATQLSWTTVPGSTAYDVVKGSLGLLQESRGDFTSSTTACLENDIGNLSTQDAEVPGPGDGIWYLIRPVNACAGDGTYDPGTAGQQGTRDPEIEASTQSCP